MDADDRIVTSLPLQRLWQRNGFTSTARGRPLNGDDITSLLRTGPIQFIVVDVGHAPRWIQLSDCFDFWKSDARLHLVQGGSSAVLDEFADGYCYFASQWHGGDEKAPLVVLEKHH